jgi:hypothetical protein
MSLLDLLQGNSVSALYVNKIANHEAQLRLNLFIKVDMIWEPRLRERPAAPHLLRHSAIFRDLHTSWAESQSAANTFAYGLSSMDNLTSILNLNSPGCL